MKPGSSAVRDLGPASRSIFITGTDTGVGKTLLTALLLVHLRQTGCPALALKPFCSGDRADAKLFHALQGDELTLDDINPFYFSEPLAPLVAARLHPRRIRLIDVLERIHAAASRLLPSTELQTPQPADRHQIKNQKSKIKNPVLLIEGVGGLLVPLGHRFNVLDLITRLASGFEHPALGIRSSTSRLPIEVLVVAPNRLGVINHALLTVRTLQSALASITHLSRRLVPPKSDVGGAQTKADHSAPRAPHSALQVVLISPRSPDASSASNPRVLSELLAPVPVRLLPFLGPHCHSAATIKSHAIKLGHILARLA